MMDAKTILKLQQCIDDHPSYIDWDSPWNSEHIREELLELATEALENRLKYCMSCGEYDADVGKCKLYKIKVDMMYTCHFFKLRQVLLDK